MSKGELASAARPDPRDPDLQHLREENRRLEAALQAADARCRAKALFLATASHDLRQPLYAVSLLADTLMLQPLDAPASQLVERQRQAIALLRAHLDNLMDLSRLEIGAMKAAPLAVSLDALVEPLASHYAQLAAAKGLEWHLELPAAHVLADPELVQRLVGNLLANAVRLTHAGRVALTARIERGRLALCVADTGPGIAPEDQASVFGEFVQAIPDRDKHDGAGLGLAIAKRISDLIDARLTLESCAGSGCRFHLSLPLTEPTASPSLATARRPPAGMRVWVAEDNPLVATALAHQLEAWRLDFRMVGSERGLRALFQSDAPRPQAIILDDLLGGLDRPGSLGAWLGARFAHSRVLVISGNTDPRRHAELLAGGFRVLAKPLSGDQLAAWLCAANAAEAPANGALQGSPRTRARKIACARLRAPITR